MADGSSLHQGAKQQHQYLHTYVQPLLRAGKPLGLKDILDHVTIRKPKLLYNDHKLLLFKPMQLSYAIAHLKEQPNLDTCE